MTLRYRLRASCRARGGHEGVRHTAKVHALRSAELAVASFNAKRGRATSLVLYTPLVSDGLPSVNVLRVPTVEITEDVAAFVLVRDRLLDHGS